MEDLKFCVIEIKRHVSIKRPIFKKSLLNTPLNITFYVKLIAPQRKFQK